MNRLAYRQSLWPMTDEQVEKEYSEKRKWKNTDELELFHEVEFEHSKRQYKKEQEYNRKTEEERVSVLVLEYSSILKRWVEQGMIISNDIYYYDEKIMYWNLSSEHIDTLILKIRNIDNDFQMMLKEEQTCTNNPPNPYQNGST